MARNIYFTDKELKALRNTCSEWCEIMSYGDSKAAEEAEDRLNDGLGSALRKLYKGLNGERIYKDYKSR